MFDDSDMKIVGETNEAEPVLGSAAELETAQQNGNLEKAKRFGALLAERVLTQSEDSSVRSVLAFAATVGMDSALPTGVVAETARNAFYNGLGAFYEELRNAGTFSFYYLCLQSGDAVEQQVGVTYANLRGNKELAAEGQRLYHSFLEESCALAETVAFV